MRASDISSLALFYYGSPDYSGRELPARSLTADVCRASPLAGNYSVWLTALDVPPAAGT